MPKAPANKTHLYVSKLKTKGCHRVAPNLYLRVDDKGNKSWLLRYIFGDKAKKIGLGSFNSLTLAKAVAEAEKLREMIKLGIDPQTKRQDDKQKAIVETALAKAKSKTFRQCAESYVEDKQNGWRNAKHRWQWTNSLEKYVYPYFGRLPVQEINTDLVEAALKPIWISHNETATRIRGRIELILDWAKTRKYRDGENPARWRGNLDNLLPKPSKVHKAKNFPSLPYNRVGSFMQALKEEQGLAAIALQVVILTATRSSETIKAEWSEFDFQQKLWTIPQTRTKTEVTLRVPITPVLMGILKEIGKNKVSKYVFPNHKLDSHLSDMAMLSVIRRMNAVGKEPNWIDPDPDQNRPIVTHGFRSTFRTWCAEQTNYPREVAEAAMSHKVGSKVELSYQRSDFFDKRRELMDKWAEYCITPSSKATSENKVIKIHGSRHSA